MVAQICADVYRAGASEDVRKLLAAEEALINKYGWRGRRFKSSGVYENVGDVLELLRNFDKCGGYSKGTAVLLGNRLAVALNAWEAEEKDGRAV